MDLFKQGEKLRRKRGIVGYYKEDDIGAFQMGKYVVEAFIIRTQAIF